MMRITAKPIAHRGLHDEARPENSLAAFRNALEHGYHIETDVHLSKDGVLFAFHDFNLKRVVGKDVKIESLTYDELKSGEYNLPNGETIPTFQELMDLVDGKTDILCELKSLSVCSYKLEEAVYEAVKGKEWITLQSFNPFSVHWMRKHHPDVVCGQLSTYGDNFLLKAGLRLFGGVTLLKWTDAQFLAYDVKYLPNPRVDKAIAEHAIPLLSWTIHEKDVETARQSHVDQLIFEGFLAGNYPDDAAPTESEDSAE